MIPSLHFVPAHRSEFYKRLHEIKASTIVFDLEDGVPLEAKEEARKILYDHAELIAKLNSFIRLNKYRGSYDKAEIKLIKELDFKGVIIPKIESDEEIIKFWNYFEDSFPDLKLICLIESFQGLEDLQQICKNISERISGVGLGLEDFFSTVPVIGIKQNVIEFIKMKLVTTCKAFDLPCIDTVSLNYSENVDKFKKECLNSKSLLFDGRFCIHPSQISIVNEIYSPTEEELSWARSIINKTKGKSEIGYIKLDSEVLSSPKVKKAQSIIKKAGVHDV